MENISESRDMKFTVHMDYIEGEPYVEIVDKEPLSQFVYDEYPISIIYSYPCTVVLRDNTLTKAVYVSATSMMPNNDGTYCRWNGFVSIRQKAYDDFKFIEDVFDDDKLLDVIRWHYTKIPPESI